MPKIYGLLLDITQINSLTQNIWIAHRFALGILCNDVSNRIKIILVTNYIKHPPPELSEQNKLQ